jgi:hypothetical protein
MFDRFSHVLLPVAASAAVMLGCAFVGTAHAESVRKECSTKYQAAKAANTLNGQSWNQFYKQCAAEVKSGAAPSAATSEPAPAVGQKTAAPAAPAAPAAIGGAVFPTAVSPAHANESPGKARMNTCLDQYKANKASNANGGLKWIQKGGGYYSECNKRLKGAA